MRLRNKSMLIAGGLTAVALVAGFALVQMSDGPCYAWYGAHISEVFERDAGYETADEAIEGIADGLGANGYQRQITLIEGSGDSGVELVRHGVGVVSFTVMATSTGGYVAGNYKVCLRKDGSPLDTDLDYSRFPSLNANVAG